MLVHCQQSGVGFLELKCQIIRVGIRVLDRLQVDVDGTLFLTILTYTPPVVTVLVVAPGVRVRV